MVRGLYSPCPFKSWRLTCLLKRWRGIVKARHLVLVICDYLKQKDREHVFGVDNGRPETPKHQSVPEDVWTLQYIDLMRVRPLIEALDPDTSGYVTIQGVNQFTVSRPKGWRSVATISLHWSA